jgi:hypothetical protein
MAAADEGRDLGRETTGPRFLLLRSPLKTAGQLPRSDRPAAPIVASVHAVRESTDGAALAGVEAVVVVLATAVAARFTGLAEIRDKTELPSRYTSGNRRGARP